MTIFVGWIDGTYLKCMFNMVCCVVLCAMAIEDRDRLDRKSASAPRVHHRHQLSNVDTIR